MIDYKQLEDEYDNLPSVGKITKDRSPQGSLTDNLRIAECNRNGAYKRVRGEK